MSIIGIVCEYNPFHNGHEYQLMMSRQHFGADTPVICVMSGDFVQRGEAAVYSKYARAEAACRCGADLVLELPLPWALSSAEAFARGAVGLLGKLGVTHLSFGSEAGETEPLEAIAQTLLDPRLTQDIKDLLSRDASLSFAAARQRAVEAKLGEVGQLLELPNNILAVEYIKAIYDIGLDIAPFTVQRYGSGHDMAGEGKGPRSASEIRRMMSAGKRVGEFIPAAAEKVYLREKEQGREFSAASAFEAAMLSRLRMFDEEYFRSLPDAADGIGNRLFKAAHEEATLDAVLAAVKTKRYALSRIRRMCLCACLGVKAGMNEGVPPYARVLAANARGCELLRDIQRKESVPVLTKPATVREMAPKCRDVFAIGASAHDFYVLGYRAPGERKGGGDWRNGPVIVNNQQTKTSKLPEIGHKALLQFNES